MVKKKIAETNEEESSESNNSSRSPGKISEKSIKNTDTASEKEYSAEKDYSEIKMGGGWYMTISLAHSDRFDKEYVEIAKERGGVKKSRFNLNPAHVRLLGEQLLKFADNNNL